MEGFKTLQPKCWKAWVGWIYLRPESGFKSFKIVVFERGPACHTKPSAIVIRPRPNCAPCLVSDWWNQSQDGSHSLQRLWQALWQEADENLDGWVWLAVSFRDVSMTHFWLPTPLWNSQVMMWRKYRHTLKMIVSSSKIVPIKWNIVLWIQVTFLLHLVEFVPCCWRAFYVELISASISA